MDREDEKKYTLDEYNWHIINNLPEFNDSPNMVKELYQKMKRNLPQHTILSKFYDIYETGLKFYEEHSKFPDIKWFEVNYAKSNKLKRTDGDFSIKVYEDCMKKVDLEIIKSNCKDLIETISPDMSDVRALKAKISEYCDNVAEVPKKKKADIINCYDNYSEDYDGISTGIDILDEYIGVMGHKSISVFGAPSGHGKSTFAVSVAYNVAVRQGKCVDYISYEVPEEHIWFNLVSMHSFYMGESFYLEASKLKENAYKNDESMKTRYKAVAKDLLETIKESGGYIQVFDQTTASVKDFESMLARIESIATERIDGDNVFDRKADLIVVDNVDNFQILQSKERDEMIRVNNYIIALDAFCKQYHHGDGCAILLLTQLNRTGMKTLNKAAAETDEATRASKIDVSVFQRYNALYEKGTCCLVGYADAGYRSNKRMDIYPVKLRNRAVPENPIQVFADYAHSLIGGFDAPESKKVTQEDCGVSMEDMKQIDEFEVEDLD